MCGLLGLAFSRDPELRRRLPAALTTLIHRGPDGQGIWSDEHVWLGHRRLAIIDLNARSDQPMVDEETGNILVYNGEVYNYRELRAELEAAGLKFRTSSDTEVLLKAYRHWGPSAFQRMNGMWAVAIWHPRERRLFLCRDRFGVKPLYYSRLRGAFLFASEPKALLATAPELAEPNADAIARLIISSESFASEDTYFRDISSVPPASWAFVDQGKPIEFQRYWHYPEHEIGNTSSIEEDQEEFEALFQSAVKLRMRSDVPVGLTLSGGLDSTAILAATPAENLEHFTAFNATFGDSGELDWATGAAQRADISLIPVDSTAANWLERLRQITWHMDAPGFSPPVFPLWNIMERARAENVLVLLEGQGADELFGGYAQYAAAHVLQQVRTGKIGAAVAAAPGLSRTFGLPLFAKWMARLAFSGHYKKWQQRAGRGSLLINPPSEPVTVLKQNDRLDPYDAMRTDHAQCVLPSLLHYGDAISMAHGVESRLPFLDYRLVEWVFRRRPAIFGGGVTKAPVRKFLLKKGYRRHAERRDKKGFTTPTHTWMFENSKWIKDTLSNDPNALLWDYIKRDEAQSLLRPRDYFSASHGYKLITIQLWLEGLSEWRRQSLPAMTKGEPC